jgi:hypothetical protein
LLTDSRTRKSPRAAQPWGGLLLLLLLLVLLLTAVLVVVGMVLVDVEMVVATLFVFAIFCCLQFAVVAAVFVGVLA